MLAIVLEVAVRRSEMNPSSINSVNKTISKYNKRLRNQTNGSLSFVKEVFVYQQNLLSSSLMQQT